MSRKKNKSRAAPDIPDVELNIMPFIDIFSLLNTFLLFTATFVSIGLLRVQVPFLSNATPESKPTRSLDINVDLSRDKVVLRTTYTTAPTNKTSNSFSSSPEGIAAFHRALIDLKHRNPKDDKVTFYSDEDVSYHKLIEVLDAIKIDDSIDTSDGITDNNKLYPKVVMGSVLL